MLGEHKPEQVQRDFLKYTGQQIKFHLQQNEPALLEQCKLDAKDRQYQIWKRNALSIDIFSAAVMLQKLDYIHWNPVKAGLTQHPEDYVYSSASFYHNPSNPHNFLSHFMG